jgi:hypothetical protein
MIKKSLIALVLSGAFASAHADVLLQQNFDNINSLSGWVATNSASTPGGFVHNWFQGDQQVFGSQNGAANSYIAANYDMAPAGGTINAWLLTPVFSTESAVDVTLWLRGADYQGFFDQVAFGFSNGSSAINDFTMNPVFTVPTNDWTMYTVHLNAQGAGTSARFGIQYANAADSANYIGLDNLTVATGADVPEPATMLIMATGLAGLAAARRRQRR